MSLVANASRDPKQYRFSRPRSHFADYCDRLGHLYDRRRAESGLVLAKQEAERQANIAQRALLESEAADRAKSHFLSAMSHELKTPLNAIIGFSDIIRYGGKDALDQDKLLEYTRAISDSGGKLLSIVTDILTYSAAIGDAAKLEESEIDPPILISGSLGRIQPTAEEGGLKIKCDIELPSPRLLGDPVRMQQLVDALLSNAVKFTPKGGSVSVRAGRDEMDGYVLEITDTGIGIAEDDIENALAPFTQLDSELNRQYEGTGLGLSLAKLLTELHGGTLEIESELDKGTTVTVTLPPGRILKDSRPGPAMKAMAEEKMAAQ